jgi:PEP-CTERM motif
MQYGFRTLVCSVVLAAASLAPVAQAAVINFEGAALTGIYFDGDSFAQSGFVMTQFADLGVVDTTAAFVSGAPTGNATQFYTNLNDGFLELTAAGGLPFSLTSFAAAFVPQSNPTTPQDLLLVAFGTTATGDNPYRLFSLGDTTSGAAHYPFLSFSNFTPLTQLIALDFFVCAVSGDTACAVATRNNAQFALDNISVTAVPEPEITALMGLGLFVVAAVARRRRSR